MWRPNLLVDRLPETVPIAGRDVPIRTGFRVGILFETMIASGELSEGELAAQSLSLWYPDESLAEIGRANAAPEGLSQLLWFYRLGREAPRASGKPGLSRRLYDFDEDAERIYAAFFSQYGIDLQTAELHWWQFSALFSGLGEGEEFVKIMGYRACELGKIKNKEERRRMARLQALYALPDRRSNEEKAAAFGSVFGASIRE